MSTLVFLDATSCTIRFSTSFLINGSNPDVGSSISITLGIVLKAISNNNCVFIPFDKCFIFFFSEKVKTSLSV